MKKNEKAEALESDGFEIYLKSKPQNQQKDITPRNKLQQKMAAFVCDECARPLNLYGAHFVESYTNGKANILRCLCDLHADEMGVNS